MDNTVKKVIKDTLPVMAGYIVLGTAFGILLESKGYSVIWAFLMSFSIYAGSMQFVAVDLLSNGASFISSAIMTLLVNARHLFYGISMLEKYKGMGFKKLYLIFSLTDETYALVCNDTPEYVNSKKYYFLVSLFNQCYWISGSVIGSIIGSAITFNTAGIDFSMTALFVVIFIEQLFKKDNLTPAIIGIGCSLFSLMIFGTDNFLIPSMLLITASLCVFGIFSSRKEPNNA